MTPRFPLLFRWHVVRHARRHTLLALLNVLAVALGVAVFVAIQIANQSANRAFSASVDVVAGKSQLELRGDIGDALFPLVEKQPGIRAATPLIEQIVTLPDFPGEYLRVLGVDVFTDEPFRTFQLTGAAGQGFEIEPWLAKPDGIALGADFAKKHGIKIGDRLRVLVNSRTRELTVLFFLNLENPAPASGEAFAAMDIGWAQEFFGMRGKLSSIQLLLRNPAHGETVVKQLQPLLPPGVTAAPPRQRSFQIEKMLGAFELNLTAMSMVSLLVGAFLIYNTIFASAARRRVEIGILRAVGATRLEVRALFLGEALLFGALGIAAGLAGGVLLARVLVGSVAKTVSSLYVLISIGEPVWSIPRLALAAFFGVVTVLAGAWIPASEAANSDPVAALTLGSRMERSARSGPWWAVAGAASLGAALLCAHFALAGTQAWLSFGAAFFVLLGFSMFAPGATALAGGFFGKTKFTLLRLAAGNLSRAAHRNAVTIAALAAAVAMAIGVSVMIFSFRNSVDAWIDRGIVADLFIAPSSNETIGLHAFVPAEAISALREMPGVAAVDTYRSATATMRGEPVEVGAVRGADRRNLRFTTGGAREKMRRFFSGDGWVIVTESFARKHGVREGDRLPVQTPGGLAEFRVAGIYYDYTSDRGLMMMDQALFEKWWRDSRVQSLAVYLAPGADGEKIAASFRQRFSPGGEFLVYSNRALRERILAIFDQTFAVTYVLRAIAVIVAVVGIFLSLTALVIERERDIGILRSLGASRGQVRGIFLTEAALLGGIASALGLAAGACLAMVLTWGVNRAFFGWTIELQFPGALLALTPLWIIASAVAAAWIPAARAGRVSISKAIRSE